MVKEIALELGIQEDWLNDGLKGFIYKQPESKLVMSYSNLQVYSATAEYILAMKCFSARPDSKDKEDAIFLKNHLGLTDYNQVLDIVEEFIPVKMLSIKNTVFAQELFI